MDMSKPIVRKKSGGAICTANGCDRNAVARELCTAHYARMQAGKPINGPLLRHGSTDAERIAFYSSKPNDSGCILWTGSVNTSGYGQMSGGTGKPPRLAHRVAFEVAGNKLDYRPIHHKCANKLCINPNHLEAVDKNSNLAEMFERKSLLKRISDLEQALTEFDDSHPLLSACR